MLKIAGLQGSTLSDPQLQSTIAGVVVWGFQRLFPIAQQGLFPDKYLHVLPL